ncbi:diguanylate cyclase (GGDEF)-like protein [Cytobacillus eiseniae]|uniref:Diguanylate cyclase (GGDEF)-like protein n=1 Tax=Cytobacillus eiseniae TaxID=762947 RepID=A0ABS4RCK4_9BACI|nr:sensor domain-containing diguanylate cyclase [Cytobacillus eiseniae]MBP2240603.1 diguanylate cyclase (GGDEF)-like protein [Cytobacillus eiseniae]
MISSNKKKIIWLLWIIIFPIGLWYTYQLYPPQLSERGIDLVIFLLMTAFVAATPLVINGSPIFFIQWVSWATFLIFGLFVELVMAQLALIVLFTRVKLTKGNYFRLPLNSLMFFLVSLLSGVFYYMMGGKTGLALSDVTATFPLVVSYPIIHYLLNHLIIILINYLFYNNQRENFGKEFVWETVTTLITFPIGFVLYILYVEVGLIALLFVGIPFISLSIILNLYYSSDKINSYLQKAAEIGHQLAEKLIVDEVIDLFIEKITELINVDFAYLLEVVDEKELHLLRCIEKGEVKTTNIHPLKKNEGISGLVWDKGEAMLFNTKKEWNHIVRGYMPDTIESVICVPIARNNMITGIILLASSQKRAYEKSQLAIVDILCSHFAISIENAKHYEETREKSERCALTSLFNYRYFDQLLNDEYRLLELHQRKRLSLIILDIDHFKKVNDTYGHQSGNEILIQLANKLVHIIDDQGTVARFGGEEFVILLPDTTREEALFIAETIRLTIAQYSFILTQHLEQSEMPISAKITASFGVATAPGDGEDAMSLIRHADRALYVGAKRAGRNRVAEYVG